MSLPVDAIFTTLAERLAANNRVILQAPPGAGKSTRLPLLLLESGLYSAEHQIVILEPRRVAARQIAHYLAKTIGQKVGQKIGLSMRGEHKTSDETVIRIVTDGVMVRQLQSNPELNNIGLIIFDEFHERALQTDLALALTLDAQELNEQVGILIMSATLDLHALSNQLDAPIVESTGRQYPVEVSYCKSSLVPSIDEIAAAVMLAVKEQSSSILVFLSGVSEIKRLETLLTERLNDGIHLYPLFGGLSIEQQVRAIQPVTGNERKIVLATNIAQTSLTIDGIDVVVDAGTEKIMVYQSKTMSEQLQTQPISISSATQRAGRAGRLRPGHCYRLGNKESFERRKQHDIAEIERVDLSQLLLEVNLWGAKFDDLFWLTSPEASLLNAAENKLVQLGYWQQSTAGYKNTELVGEFQRSGLSLRFTKMLSFAIKYGTKTSELLSTAIVLACYLEQQKNSSNIDLISVIERLSSNDWFQLSDPIKRLANKYRLSGIKRTDIDLDIIPVLLASAYPDKIGKKQGRRWKLSNGSAVEFHSSSTEPNAEFIVVGGVNASEYGQFINLFVAIDNDQLKQALGELVVEEEVTVWSQQKQAPQKLKQQRIGQLSLSQTPMPLNLSEQDWQQVWLDAVNKQGWGALAVNDEFETLLSKLKLIQSTHPELLSLNVDKGDLLKQLQKDENWLVDYLSSVRSLAQLKKLNLSKILLAQFDWNLQQEINRLCPERYQTPAGNYHKINYLNDQPKLSIKLQEMFGEPSSPAICNGRVKLTIELLSPGKKTLQVTQDLQHFWQNAYIEVKKEMKGRYPKHPWPDDPVGFEATHKTKRQLNNKK